MAGRQPQLSPLSSMAPPAQADCPRLALFDLDRTLLPGSSLVALGRALADDGLLSRAALVRGTVADVTFRRRGASDRVATRVRERATGAAAGLERSMLSSIANRVAHQLASTIPPAARLLVDLHLDRGDFCVVLSASPQELVEPMARVIGAHRAVGTRAEVVDGRYTGELQGAFCYGDGKLRRLAEAVGPVDLRRAWAYADSSSDLPVLRAVGHPVAVNPDRSLRKVALSKDWPILQLR